MFKADVEEEVVGGEGKRKVREEGKR